MHLAEIVQFLLQWHNANAKGSKKQLAAALTAQTDLQFDRALWHNEHCALRVSQMQEVGNESDSVLAFRKICEHDDRPIVVCLLTSKGMRLLLANTTLVETVSDRSYKLRANNLTGSILDSDIRAAHEGIANIPGNFAKLWQAHQDQDPAANLERIVAATAERHARELAANPGRVVERKER
ncbi:MAG: hypothetical protein AB8H80_18885 [Planctomycetota bacterium]